MQIVNLPDLRMIRGISFSQDWQWLTSSNQPINLSEFTATIVFHRKMHELLAVALATSADGGLTMSLTSDEVEALTGPSATYQITIITPFGQVAEVWRGGVLVQ